MYCDYIELANYTMKLNSLFKQMNDTMDSIEASYKTIYNGSNWNSETRNYFLEKTKEVFTNMESINSKFFNVKQYLDTVVDNYTEADQKLGNIFNFKG